MAARDLEFLLLGTSSTGPVIPEGMPFLLDDDLLIEHAHGAAMSELMAEMFTGHRQVITAPPAGQGVSA